MPDAAQVRLITVPELDIVRDLALQIWPKCYRRTVAPDLIDTMVSSLFDIDTLEDDMCRRGHVYWVVRAGRVDVGFASAHMEGNRIWISKLAILPDFRGYGLASQLIRAVQAFYAPAHEVVICVHKDHEQAVDFCLKSGFSIAHETPSHLDQYGFTDYVMRKDLRRAAVSEVYAA